MNDHKERPIKIWIPTGTGLLTMGVLTLTTPLFTTLTDRQLLIDCVAGGTLVLAGIGCVVQGIRFLR